LVVDYEYAGQGGDGRGRGFDDSLDRATIEVEEALDESNRQSVDDVRSAKANSRRRSRRSQTQASKPDQTKPSGQTLSENMKKLLAILPANAIDQTSQKLGETLVITGARRPARKP
jgi:hypothetical protein